MIGRLLRERTRSRAVQSTGVLERTADADFDRFVQQAAAAFVAPISLLTLIRDESLWIKAATGLVLQCMPRENGFCNHALDHGEPLEVCDARAHPQFQALPSVTGEPRIRYYIGAPLTMADGIDIGALCVLDTRPRRPASRDQRAYLVGLARQASQALERSAHVRGTLAA